MYYVLFYHSLRYCFCSNDVQPAVPYSTSCHYTGLYANPTKHTAFTAVTADSFGDREIPLPPADQYTSVGPAVFFKVPIDAGSDRSYRPFGRGPGWFKSKAYETYQNRLKTVPAATIGAVAAAGSSQGIVAGTTAGSSSVAVVAPTSGSSQGAAQLAASTAEPATGADVAGKAAQADQDNNTKATKRTVRKGK